MTTDGENLPARVRAVIQVGPDAEQWAATIVSLIGTGAHVVLCSDEPAEIQSLFGHLDVVTTQQREDALVEESLDGQWDALFVVRAPVVVPTDAFGPALDFLSSDIRIATVSFFSNDAYFLSFPNRNSPTPLPPDGHNEESLTALLRSGKNAMEPVPIPIPAGAGVLVSCRALRSVGGPIPNLLPEISITDFALRAMRRGFRNVLDPTTYLTRPPVQTGSADQLGDAQLRHILHGVHPSFPALVDDTMTSQHSPVLTALRYASARVRGLRVLIDATCLGPYEMGTQVQTLALIRALCRHNEIREVVVGLQGEVPPYAREALAHPKIRTCTSEGWTFPDAGEVDIFHRPYQPDTMHPWKRWRDVSQRVVLTIQDLIAYDNGSYHSDGAAWLQYRETLRQGVGNVDAVVAISQDTATSIRHAGLPVPAERVFVSENGTDHPLGENLGENPPIELMERNLLSSQFLLCLGASYAHKNRDLAMRAWRELRDRGHQIELVLAGVVVPYGSTRNDEAIAASRGGAAITLPDVNSEERNWLMRHAAAVLYPTSAEGFGLVPFEAARFDTPTVFVGFGPLDEVLGSVPVRASEWSPPALADAVEQLLDDPQLAARQVSAVLKSGAQYTWDDTAAKLVGIYQTLLSSPRSLL